MIMDRRTAINTLATASLGVAFSKAFAWSQQTTIVLVHAAWADGSNWEKVIQPLARHGLPAICPQLALMSLSDDVATVQRAMERTTGPVVLVGHAYSGAVIGSIRDDRVKSLVFIAALAPAEGETVADVFYKDPKPPLSPKLAPDAHGFIWQPEDGIQNALAQNASAEEKRIMGAVQRPLNAACIKEKAPATAWPAKPTWYMVAEEDRMINPVTERFMAARMNAKVKSLRVDHSPQVTAPGSVVDMIVEAAS